MKTKIKVLSGTFPKICSHNFRSEENSTSIAIYTTARSYAHSPKTAVEESRFKLSLLFSCCLTKGIRPILPIQLGESASWSIGKYEKMISTARTAAGAPIVYFTVLS